MSKWIRFLCSVSFSCLRCTISIEFRSLFYCSSKIAYANTFRQHHLVQFVRFRWKCTDASIRNCCQKVSCQRNDEAIKNLVLALREIRLIFLLENRLESIPIDPHLQSDGKRQFLYASNPINGIGMFSSKRHGYKQCFMFFQSNSSRRWTSTTKTRQRTNFSINSTDQSHRNDTRAIESVLSIRISLHDDRINQSALAFLFS